MTNDATRKRTALARTLLLTSLIGMALTAGLVFVSSMACLMGCNGHLLWERIVAILVVSVTILANAGCVVNFLFRLFKHGWKGLGGWEKAVLYIGALLLVAQPPVSLVSENLF